MKTDSQIQTDVMQELKWDPSVTREHIARCAEAELFFLEVFIPLRRCKMPEVLRLVLQV